MFIVQFVTSHTTNLLSLSFDDHHLHVSRYYKYTMESQRTKMMISLEDAHRIEENDFKFQDAQNIKGKDFKVVRNKNLRIKEFDGYDLKNKTIFT